MNTVACESILRFQETRPHSAPWEKSVDPTPSEIIKRLVLLTVVLLEYEKGKVKEEYVTHFLKWLSTIMLA